MFIKEYFERLIALITSDASIEYIDRIGILFKKAPHLPKNWTDSIVRVIPILVLIGIFFGIWQSITTFRLVIALLQRPEIAPTSFSLIYLLVRFSLQVLGAAVLYKAYEPVKEFAYKGWVLLFWNEVINVAGSFLEIVFGSEISALGLLLGTLIALYALYEIRPRYRGTDVL